MSLTPQAQGFRDVLMSLVKDPYQPRSKPTNHKLPKPATVKTSHCQNPQITGGRAVLMSLVTQPYKPLSKPTKQNSLKSLPEPCPLKLFKRGGGGRAGSRNNAALMGLGKTTYQTLSNRQNKTVEVVAYRSAAGRPSSAACACA
jgi:hypothetical protein